MILIRADANEFIGTGHIMRCKTIAQAFIDHGEKVQFVTADHQSDSLLREFQTICLESSWKYLNDELKKLQKLIEEVKPCLLFLDSYYVTQEYFYTLRGIVRLAYIDDLNEKCWDSDYVINYNIYAALLDYSRYRQGYTEILLGPKYAPLRTEFRHLPMHAIQKHVTDVLVSAGGADPQRITERIISEVCPAFPEIRFHFIVGGLNPRIEEIKKLENESVILHINEQNVSELMLRCDIAISAAGTTLYELCACGIPTITYVLADNQIRAAQTFEEQGFMLNAGDCRNNPTFEKDLIILLQGIDSTKRKELSYKMCQLVDGKGAERIVKRLMVNVTVEPCIESDFDDYYAIRCGESDIFWMGYDGPPEREMMKKVFLSRLGGNCLEKPGDKRIYMIKADDRNVGFIQFSLSDEGLEFGYSVLDQERGKGYGSSGMTCAVRMAKQFSDYCFAHIRDDNIASQKAMMEAGLKPTDEYEMRPFPKTGMVAYRKYVLAM